MATLTAGGTSSATIALDAFASIAVVCDASCNGTLSFASSAPNLLSNKTAKVQNKTYGPYGVPGTVTISVVAGSLTYEVSYPNGVTSIFQPSRFYKFFIPGQQFLGSGSAKDKSGNSADAALGSAQSDAEAWANPGYMSTAAGANEAFTIPLAKFTFDLATQSVIFSGRIKKAAPVGAEIIAGCGNTSTAQGFYLSMRAASGSVSKIRPILNTSGGAVTGLADSTATFGEAAATDHVVTLAIDGLTKGVYLYCDGCLSNSYTSAFTGGTTLTVPFGIGASTGASGDTGFVTQWSGVHMLVMTGGLPTNIGIIAQKLAGAPHLWLSDSDFQF